MDTSASQVAIALALSGKWSEALEVNLKILKEDPSDTEALCRLARAYSEMGKIPEAKEATNKVLQIDPLNQIALKFCEKLKHAKSSTNPIPSPSCNESFLEEPGKTKLVQLMNLGEEENYLNLDPGEEVRLIPYTHRVSITTTDGEYVGRLPDDIAARLKYLMKKGCKYQTLVKSVAPKEVAIFIREVEKGSGVNSIPSFPPEKIDYVSFTPPELVHGDIPDIEIAGETSEN